MSLSDYSSIENEIANAPDMRILPNNTEAKLRIVRVDSGIIDDESKSTYGAEWHSVTFDVPDDDLCPMFNDFFWDLNSRDKLNSKQYSAALRQFRDFAKAFGIDYTRPFSWEDDLPGLEGWAILKVVKDKNGEYPDKNGIKRYIVPK